MIDLAPWGLFVKTSFRGGGLFESGGIFIQVNSRVGLFVRHIRANIKYFLYYIFDELYLCQ